MSDCPGWIPGTQHYWEDDGAGGVNCILCDAIGIVTVKEEREDHAEADTGSGSGDRRE
jgi:hypothetical protein